MDTRKLLKQEAMELANRGAASLQNISQILSARSIPVEQNVVLCRALQEIVASIEQCECETQMLLLGETKQNVGAVQTGGEARSVEEANQEANQDGGGQEANQEARSSTGRGRGQDAWFDVEEERAAMMATYDRLASECPHLFNKK